MAEDVFIIILTMIIKVVAIILASNVPSLCLWGTWDHCTLDSLNEGRACDNICSCFLGEMRHLCLLAGVFMTRAVFTKCSLP